MPLNLFSDLCNRSWSASSTVWIAAEHKQSYLTSRNDALQQHIRLHIPGNALSRSWTEIVSAVYRLVQLALTLPVGTSSSERSFSAMRWIKNWLRSIMNQDWFSSLAVLNIEPKKWKLQKSCPLFSCSQLDKHVSWLAAAEWAISDDRHCGSGRDQR